jgi:hypothetical protein
LALLAISKTLTTDSSIPDLPGHAQWDARQLPALHRRRGASFSADQWRGCDIGDLPNWGPMPSGCSRLIVTRWIPLPPRVRLASFKHSASSQGLLLAGFCCSCLFCFLA